MRERWAAPGLAQVEGLGDVEVEGLPRGHAEVETVSRAIASRIAWACSRSTAPVPASTALRAVAVGTEASPSNPAVGRTSCRAAVAVGEKRRRRRALVHGRHWF
jgi:hypothetical protein